MTMMQMMLGAGGSVQIVGATSTEMLSDSTSILIDKPANTVAGDVLMVFLGNGGNWSYTQPAGWAEVLDTGNTNVGCVAWLELTGSEGADFTWTLSSNHKASGAIVALRGCDYGTIGTPGADDATTICPEITLASRGLVLALLASQKDGIWDVASGWERVIRVVASGNAPNIDIQARAFEAGPTGDQTFAGSGAAVFNRYEGVLVGFPVA